MIKNLHALLVGINEHHPQSQGVENLNGCVNDVNVFEALLRENYAQLNPQICKLINEQATRDNIIYNFRNHLTAQANEQSVVFFYYSGHGSIQSASEVFQQLIPSTEEVYLKEETLVCYDSRAVVDNQWIGEDLADKEMAILIEEVAKKGAHVIVILDCCHSGSGTRYIPWLKAKNQTPRLELREVKARDIGEGKGKILPGFKRKYLDGYYHEMFEKTGKVTIPEGKHILMSACQKNQLSCEYTFEGERRGVFSYYLTKILKNYPSINFDQLFKQTHTQVINAPAFRNRDRPQNPQFESYGGFDAYSNFVSAYATMRQVSENVKRKRYLTKYKNGRWQIDFGVLDGLAIEEQRPIEWNVFAEPLSVEYLAKAKTTTALPNCNAVDVYEGKLDVNKQFWAEMTSLLSNYFEISLVDSQGCLQVSEEKPISPLFRFIPEVKEGAAMYALDIDQTGYKILRDGKVIYETQTTECTQAIVKLEQIVRWHLLLGQTNQRSQLQNVFFPLSFNVEDQASKELLEMHDFVEIKSKEGKYKSNKWEVPFEIFAQNNSTKDLYFTLLHFSPDYAINVFYNDFVSQKSEKLKIVKGGYLSTEGRLQTVDHFKLIVSTQPLENYRFEQPALDDQKTKNVKDLLQNTAASLSHDWVAKTLQVVTDKVV